MHSEVFGELTLVDRGEVEFNLKTDPLKSDPSDSKGSKFARTSGRRGKLTFLTILDAATSMLPASPVSAASAEEAVLKFDEYFETYPLNPKCLAGKPCNHCLSRVLSEEEHQAYCSRSKHALAKPESTTRVA